MLFLCSQGGYIRLAIRGLTFTTVPICGRQSGLGIRGQSHRGKNDLSPSEPILTGGASIVKQFQCHTSIFTTEYHEIAVENKWPTVSVTEVTYGLRASDTRRMPDCAAVDRGPTLILGTKQRPPRDERSRLYTHTAFIPLHCPLRVPAAY